MSIKYADDITEKPLFMDIELLKDALENALLVECPEIESAHFSMGSSAGDNYCSIIYRVHIRYTSKQNANDDHQEFIKNKSNGSETNHRPLETISMIIKCIYNDKSAQFLKELRIFHKEKIFYTNILPRLEALLMQQRIPVKFGAR